MKVILLAAHNSKRVIGRNGALPWHLPEDLRRFKNLTLGQTVVMGRKTFEAIGHPLSGRRNIVLSRTLESIAGAEVYRSMEDVFRTCGDEECVWVIGGEEIFRQTMDRADEMMLTIVDNNDEGEAHFPDYAHHVGSRWKLYSAESRRGFRFEHYIRWDDRSAIP